MSELKSETKVDSDSVSEIYSTDKWKSLIKCAKDAESIEIKNLLSKDKNKFFDKRQKAFIVGNSKGNITLDFSRQKITLDTFNKLIELAKEAKLSTKINSMFNGDKINITENRRVLHVALRANKTDKIITKDKDGNECNEVTKVWKVLDKIKAFSNKVRNGEWKGFTDKKLVNVISIGIGGSYLGCEFVYEALKTNYKAYQASKGRKLRFYANIDPIGFMRAINELNPEETLCIVVSKSFKTRETMMNGELIKQWLLNHFNNDPKCLTKHFIAVSANPELPIKKFGVDKDNIFEFWDWVGGRYSVTSAVGILPLSLQFGFDIMLDFLKGCNNIDVEFKTQPFSKNIPVILGLLGVYNSTFLGYKTRGLIPYCEALSRLPAHIQQLDMESNGKGVNVNGNKMTFDCGEIDFGEPGTNAQHSFFQLIHQGQTIPIDFIGFKQSQMIKYYNDNKVLSDLIKNNHDELMSNLFAQSDALAFGKDLSQVKKENPDLKPSIQVHKVFTGNRPSSILLFNGELTPFECGQLLSIFEHRTAVQGFIWNICSFDQFGVELGKVLSKKIRASIDAVRDDKTKIINTYCESTNAMLNKYLK